PAAGTGTDLRPVRAENLAGRLSGRAQGPVGEGGGRAAGHDGERRAGGQDAGARLPASRVRPASRLTAPGRTVGPAGFTRIGRGDWPWTPSPTNPSSRTWWPG